MSNPRIIKTLLLSFIITGLNISTINTTFARWANPSDAGMETEQITKTVYINKDGTSIETLDMRAKILKEDYKNYWAHLSLAYNSDASKMKILEAKTIVNGKEYLVPDSQIEDKPVSSNVQGFDQTNQITIAYPHLETNAITHLKHQSIETKTATPNFYANYFTFGDNIYSKSQTVSIRSELPLYVETNDPEKILTIRQSTQPAKGSKSKTLYLIDIIQNKPFFKSITDEEKGLLNPKSLPLVSVSSMKDWNAYGKLLAVDYEKIKQQPLPSLYKEIADIAKTKKTPIEQINIVTSLLAEKITYLSDMRTVNGRFVPQPLQKVANARLGDCKDFAMATSAILQSIGIPSQFALVSRGEANLPIPSRLPGAFHFNHVIVKAALPTGALWVDPTNFSSMANYTFPDVSDRKTLILDVNHSNYESIPPVKASEQHIVKRETWDMRNPAQLKIKGTVQFLGNSARFFAGKQNISSDASIKHDLIDALSDNYGQILSYDVVLPDLKTRIVNDQSFAYTIKARNSGLRTNAGIAIPLTYKIINNFVTKKDTVSDVYIGTPRIVESHVTIQNITPIGKLSLDCKIESPWVDVTRVVQYDNNQIAVHQQMKVKQSWIEGKSLESDEYKKLQLAIAQNFNNGIAIIFEPKE